MIERDARRRKPGPEAVPLDPLLSAAAEVFAEQGFADATVAAIATRGNTTKPTLYKHFSDKATLYERCLEREFEHARQHLFAAYGRAEDLTIDDEVAADVAAFFDYAAARPHGFRLIVEMRDAGPPSDLRDRFNEAIVSRVADRMGAVVGVDPEAPAIRQLAAMVVGASVYAARESLLVSGVDPGEAIAIAARFIAGGLRALMESAPNPAVSPSAPSAPSAHEGLER
ncbi:TetR/AcrR family transcriptional regulator [Williamsia herbipolensis]|uniref:TetR/AcrR family transcriptional regulator n=1 Tax=Williamsia herbipolensis TaxID=1603258 RepID=UPI0009E5B6AF|nr:TetR/AcrR family transcriptional regulator [Williamsia herbipolensis]